MPRSQRNSRPGSISSEHNSGLTKSFQDTSSLRQLQLATYPVRIVRGRKQIDTWILDSSGKSLMRLVDSDLEALAFTFLGSRSSTQALLKLVPISKKRIWVILSSSQPMEHSLKDTPTVSEVSMLIKSYGAGEQKLDGPKNSEKN